MPTINNPVYLDYNATTPLLPAVVDAMLPFFTTHFGNPSSQHVFGQQARAGVVRARRQVAALIGCQEQEIFFTSGGTESNNLAIAGTLAAQPQRRHIITSMIEHPATEMPCRQFEARDYRITRLGVDGTGMIRLDALQTAIQEGPALVTIMHANSETGTLQPLHEIAAQAHEFDAIVHTDAAQTAGKIDFSVADLGVDLLSLVGHKMYAPKGIGALYVRTGTTIDAQLHGGGHEHGLRPGTENVPAIVGLGKACEIARADLEKTSQRLLELRQLLWKLLHDKIPGLALNGHPRQRLPNTLNIRFPGVTGASILANAPEIAASTGSACHTDQQVASAVIRAMGIAENQALGSVRLSLGRGTSIADVRSAAKALTRAWQKLSRSYSP